jgi:hypothetical protein
LQSNGNADRCLRRRRDRQRLLTLDRQAIARLSRDDYVDKWHADSMNPDCAADASTARLVIDNKEISK